MKSAALLLTFLIAVFFACFLVSGCGEDAAKIEAERLAAAKPGDLSEKEIDKLPEGRHEVFWRDKRSREWLFGGERNYVEARAWFKREKIAGFEMDIKQMSELAEKLYEAGAKTVYVTGITTIRPSDFDETIVKDSTEDKAKSVQISAALAAELSEDATARKAVIETAAAILKEIEDVNYPTEDMGQRYIAFILD